MYAKVLVLIAITTVVAMLLLAMRQQRVEAMHGMVSQHRQINENRQMLWEWQSRIAGTTNPVTLRQALKRTGLALEPANTSRPLPLMMVRVPHEQP
jgi:cell division protein FtsL